MPKKYYRKTDRPYEATKPKAVPVKFKAGFISTLDKRTDLAKTLRTNYETIVSDLGGRDSLSKIKSSLIERYVWLEAILQTIENDMASSENDRAESLGKWNQAVNTLIGISKALGLERKATNWAFINDEPSPSSPQEKGR